MQNRTKFFCLAVLLLAGVLTNHARAANLEGVCQSVYRSIFEGTKEMRADLWKKTNFFYWGRLNAQIQTVPAEKLKDIFEKQIPSYEAFLDLYYGIQGGALKSSQVEKDMMDEMYHMVQDLRTGGADPFWGPAPDRAYAIREALRLHDAKLEYSSDPTYAAQLTAKGLEKTTWEALMRAVGDVQGTKYENSKIFDGIRRFLSYHYDKMDAVLKVDASLRRQLQKMYTADVPATEAIAKYREELKLTDAELKELQGLISDTANHLGEVRKDIVILFGREVSPTNPVTAAQIRIADLPKRTKETAAAADEAKLGFQSEKDMDVIDRVMGGAWNRGKKVDSGFPVEAKTPEHLEIRYPQYRRETPQLRQAYLSVTEQRNPQRSSYDVKKTWTVDVTYSVPIKREVQETVMENGNPKLDSNGRTVTEKKLVNDKVTLHRSYELTLADKLRAYYEEVLKNGVNPKAHMGDLDALPEPRSSDFPSISESDVRGFDKSIKEVSLSSASESGQINQSSLHLSYVDEDRIKEILKQGSETRAAEAPFRDLIAHATQVTDQVTNEAYKKLLATKSTAALVKTLEQEKAALEVSRKALLDYHAQDATKIQTRWTNDVPEDFKDRNLQMINRFTHMIKRIDHLAEQVRRQVPSLEIEYKDMPDFEKPMQILLADKKKKQKQKAVAATTVVVTGAAAGAYTYRESIMEGIRSLFGMDQNRDSQRGSNGR